ncbi:MAG: DUF882 domain-containing protein [Gammaproteobacteria bacterium]|nr:DUF882 domain-containing protein [Gammaproteobacteria bacterium]
MCKIRRSFLKCSAAIAASSTFPQLIHANTDKSSERTLEFINLHTDETLRCCYWANGEYDPSGLNEINHILRDHRANEVYDMDARLIDLLHVLHKTVSSKAPFHIISGYRSPQTNQKLQQQRSGVAKRSLHMQGKAIDIRLPDVKLSQLRDAAISLKTGGVGFYAKSNFIHIDTGKFRTW